MTRERIETEETNQAKRIQDCLHQVIEEDRCCLGGSASFGVPVRAERIPETEGPAGKPHHHDSVHQTLHPRYDFYVSERAELDDEMDIVSLNIADQETENSELKGMLRSIVCCDLLHPHPIGWRYSA